eukprot:Skav231195  [mRNA]  locus=scaffold2432:28466:32405:+ [translate_table: standard]
MFGLVPYQEPPVTMAQPPLTAEEARGLTRRVREKEAAAVEEAAVHSCDRLITAGMSGAVVPLLQSGHVEALRLLAELGRRSLEMPMPGGAPLHKRMAEALMTADGLQPLVALLSKDMSKASLAAQSLGHICFHNPPAQLRAARAGAIRALVRLIGRRSEGSVRSSTYALWNILVGQTEHSSTAFREGAAATLLPIITSMSGDDQEALVNALGCVTSLLTVADAQGALGANGAVEALCGLLDDNWPLAVREQAASALANLLSGHNENCRKAAYKAAGLHRLMRLLQVSIEVESHSRLAENCCAALANLAAATGPMLAQDALDAGVLDLAAAVFRMNHRPVQVFGLLANLCWQLPHLCPRVYQMTPIERLVDVLKPGEEQTPRACLAALALAANFASVGSAKTRLLKAGILKPTATFIESSVDYALRLHAAITLANLLENSPESVAKVFLELPDLPRRLAFLLNKKTPLPSSVREHVARALGLLASREASRVSVKESGAPEALWSLLETDLAKGASMGMLNLALVAKDRDKMLKKGVVKRLVHLLPDPQAGHFAAGALANLTAGSRSAARQAAEAGAVKRLVASMHSLCEEQGVTGASVEITGGVDSDAAAWVLGALAHIVDLVDTAQVRQESAAAVPAVCRLLRLGQGSVQDLAIFALAAMAKNGEHKQPGELRRHLLDLEATLRTLSTEMENPGLREKAVMLHRFCLTS